jgi:hypothetical protein
MEIHYCDLCASPIKSDRIWVLSVTEPVDIETEEDLKKHFASMLGGQKEICVTCKHMIDDIFSRRLDAMSEMSKECYGILKVPYIPKIDDKKKKGKNE